MGSGFKRIDDHWNVDVEPKCNPDQVLDLEVTPWPYEDDFFEKIEQSEVYNDLAAGIHNMHKIKPSLQKTTINCVEYLGLDLYEQYNREIFWNTFI